VVEDVQYGYKAKSATGTFFNFLAALGEVAFAYAGHNVVLEIQATIPSTPEKPSKGPMWKGVIFAYIVVALCYFPVALVGYYIFGNSVTDNILVTLEKPKWIIATANMFVVIHVIGSYQVMDPSRFSYVLYYIFCSQYISLANTYKSAADLCNASV
jgi:amino acid permease